MHTDCWSMIQILVSTRSCPIGCVIFRNQYPSGRLFSLPFLTLLLRRRIGIEIVFGQVVSERHCWFSSRRNIASWDYKRSACDLQRRAAKLQGSSGFQGPVLSPQSPSSSSTHFVQSFKDSAVDSHATCSDRGGSCMVRRSLSSRARSSLRKSHNVWSYCEACWST